MSFSSNIKKYKNRITDISIFHGLKEQGEVAVRINLHENEICTGTQKLVQQIFITFLTELGTDPFNSEKGTEFVTRLRRGLIRTENDLLTEFGAAVDLVLQQIQTNTPTTAPAEEQLVSLELDSHSITDDKIMLQIKVTTQAGPSRAIILPLDVPVSGVSSSIPEPLIREEEKGVFKRRIRKDRPIDNTSPAPVVIVPPPPPPPPVVHTGACCLPDGSCAVVTSDECAALGGVYSGDGISCDQVSCPQPPPPVTPPAIYQIPYPISQMQYSPNLEVLLAYDPTSAVEGIDFATDVAINGRSNVSAFETALEILRERNPRYIFGTYCNGNAARKTQHMLKYPFETLPYEQFADDLFFQPDTGVHGYDNGSPLRGYLDVTLALDKLQGFYDAYEAEIIRRRDLYDFKIIMCDNTVSTTAASRWYSWNDITTHIKRLKTICHRNGLTFVINLAANILQMSNSDLDKLIDCCDGVLLENFFHHFYWNRPADVKRIIPQFQYLLSSGLFVGLVPNPYDPAGYGNVDPYLLAAMLCMMAYKPTNRLYTCFTQSMAQPQFMRWPALAGAPLEDVVFSQISATESKLTRRFTNGTWEINFPAGTWTYPTFQENGGL